MGNGELLFSVNLCQSSAKTTLTSLKNSLKNDQYIIPTCSTTVNSAVTNVTAEAYEGGNICINVMRRINGTGPSPQDYTTTQTKMCASARGEISLLWSAALSFQRITEGQTQIISVRTQPTNIPNTNGLSFSPDAIKKAFQAIMAKKPKPADSL